MSLPMGKTAVTIGVFDGVHRGHGALVEAARRAVGPSGRVLAMVFDPHPLTALKTRAAPANLSNFEQKIRFLRTLGVDEIIRLDPTLDLLRLSPEEFIDRIVAPREPAVVVEGDDFRFGRARAGDVETLAELGSSRGFDVEVVPPVDVTLSDQTQVRASSTIARWLIQQGRMRDAAIVLGRFYEVSGVVEEGDQRGRTIGCPTANLRPDSLLPADAVYAGFAALPGGRVYPSAISVGVKPTYGERKRAFEAHLIGWRGDGVPDYGWPLQVMLTHWLRDQIRYDESKALVNQVERDKQRTLEHAATWWRPAPGYAQPGEALREIEA